MIKSKFQTSYDQTLALLTLHAHAAQTNRRKFRWKLYVVDVAFVLPFS